MSSSEVREANNPFCVECNIVKTNHRCAYVDVGTGKRCGIPVCAICKVQKFHLDGMDPSRCSMHVGDKSDQVAVTTGGVRLVSKNVQRLCTVCKENFTPYICTFESYDNNIRRTCGKAVCISCKLKTSGPLFDCRCAEHMARKGPSMLMDSFVTDNSSKRVDAEDIHDQMSDERSQDHDPTVAPMIAIYASCSKVSAGVIAGCTKCKELSTMGTSKKRHGVKCPNRPKATVAAAGICRDNAVLLGTKTGRTASVAVARAGASSKVTKKSYEYTSSEESAEYSPSEKADSEKADSVADESGERPSAGAKRWTGKSNISDTCHSLRSSPRRRAGSCHNTKIASRVQGSTIASPSRRSSPRHNTGSAHNASTTPKSTTTEQTIVTGNRSKKEKRKKKELGQLDSTNAASTTTISNAVQSASKALATAGRVANTKSGYNASASSATVQPNQSGGRKKTATLNTSEPSLLYAGNDNFLGKCVSFNVESEVGKLITNSFSVTVSSSTLTDGHIVGNVLRKSGTKGGAGTLIYDVAWRYSGYGVTPISLNWIILGIETYNNICKDLSPTERNSRSGERSRVSQDPYERSLVMKNLLASSVLQDPKMPALSSESEDSGDDVKVYDYFNDNHLDRVSAGRRDDVDLFISEDEESMHEVNVDDIEGLEWDPMATLEHNPEKMIPTPSMLKSKHESHFESPTSAFFAFLPVLLWEKITFESNKYAHEMMKQSSGKIAGQQWRKDVTLQEMLQFHGLLLKMVLHPIPGRRYRHYWVENDLYRWVSCMTLNRFKQIRSVLHFNSNDADGAATDPLHKVRPVYATIQSLIGQYIDYGSEFSLDEASAACRSAFGRNLIVYNPTKNCGKFHFRFYLMCCAVTYACIKLRIHVKTNEMVDEDAYTNDAGDTNEVPEMPEMRSNSVLNRLVVDMASPLYGRGHTINFNNYYASPAVAIELKRKKVFCRGTVRLKRRLLSRYVMFTKSEAKKKGARGNSKIAVNKKYGLVAAGWLDGNPVHVISSADTENITTVQRKVGGKKLTISAPEVVHNYNKGMDGVDRHDQYRAGFSLCDRHGFKKYFVKLYLALIDMAVTNAYIHYKLRWKGCGNPDKAKLLDRADFIEFIATSLMSLQNEWEDHCEVNTDDDSTSSQTGLSQQLLRELFVNGGHGLFTKTNNDNNIAGLTSNNKDKCIFDSIVNYGLSKKQKKCQICDYEKRGGNRYNNVLVCRTHNIRACGFKRPVRELDSHINLLVEGTNEPVTDYSWVCGDTGEYSCMDKFHQFYQPKGLFTRNPRSSTNKDKKRFVCLRLGCDLYKSRQRALGITSHEGRGRKKGTKNKKKRKCNDGRQSTTDGEEVESSSSTNTE